LQCYRLRLLEHFHSLHDAFSSQIRSSSWEVVLGPKEMRTELSRISDDADELFVSSGMNWPVGLSIASLFYKLVGSSPESLLWELRCRLASSGLWHHGNLRLTDLAKCLSHESIKACSDRAEADCQDLQATPYSSCNSIDDTDDDVSTPLKRITQEAWLELCIRIGLTDFEAHKLYQMLRTDMKHDVDFDRMKDVLRAVVAPGASIIELAASMLEQFGSFRDAFRANCRIDAQVMSLSCFCRLTTSLGVNERSSRKLWALLTQDMSIALASDEDSPEAKITEDAFVEYCVKWSPDILPWAPNVALRALDRQINQQFSSFMDCRRALRKHGLPSGHEITSLQLRDAFTAIGITRCDTDVLLHKARQVLRLGGTQRATFDDIEQTLRVSWQNSLGDGQSAAGYLHTWHTWNADKQLNQVRHNSALFPGLPSHFVCSEGLREEGTYQSPSVSPAPSSQGRSSSPALIKGCKRNGSQVRCPRMVTMEAPPEVLSRQPSKPRLRDYYEDAKVKLPKLPQEVAELVSS
jgi:hypothetical protein